MLKKLAAGIAFAAVPLITFAATGNCGHGNQPPCAPEIDASNILLGLVLFSGLVSLLAGKPANSGEEQQG